MGKRFFFDGIDLRSCHISMWNHQSAIFIQSKSTDTAFARVMCAPLSDVEGGRHVLVLKPLTPLVPAPPAEAGKARSAPQKMPVASAAANARVR